MKLIVNLKLKPLESQHEDLLKTLERANEACNWISEQAFENNVFKQFNIHKITYLSAKDMFNLSSQMVIRSISKVAASYQIQKTKQTFFRKHGSIAYDSRILTFKSGDKVSVWTLNGRQTIPFACGEHQRKLLPFLKGEVDLIYRKGQFFLNAVCDIEEAPFRDTVGVLGIDCGIVKLATDSDGESFSGEKVEQIRNRFHNQRAQLQSKGTRSAKRKLKKISGKQSNFQKNTNHVISKAIVSKAKCTNRSIKLEDLSGIRTGAKVRKSQRSRLANWGFYQLQQHIEYKSKREGIKVEFVDPRNTSRMCSKCSHTDKANRKSQSDFLCKSCGFSSNADWNAALNIKAKSTSLTVSKKTNVAASASYKPLPIGAIGSGS